MSCSLYVFHKVRPEALTINANKNAPNISIGKCTPTYTRAQATNHATAIKNLPICRCSEK